MSKRGDVQSVMMGLGIIAVLFLILSTGSATCIEVRDPMSGDAWFSHDTRTIHWHADVLPQRYESNSIKGNDYVLTIVSDCDNTETYI